MKDELLGFTTRTFAKPLREGRVVLEDVLEWAAAHDFGWVELRDTGAKIEDAYLRKLDAFSSASGLAVHYAWDGSNLLSASNDKLFAEGLRRASCFRSGKYSRVTIAGEVLKADRTKLGYSPEEVSLISRRMVEEIRAASSFEIIPVFENSYEPLHGDGKSYQGIVELLQSVEEMRLAFDPANFLNLKTPRAIPTWEALSDFYSKYSRRIPYVHLKSAGVDGLLPTLEIQSDHEAACIQQMWLEEKLLCIELPEIDDPKTAMKNILSAKERLSRLRKTSEA